MRKFAWSLMAVCALAIGCNKPVETVPSVAPSSGTTDSHDDHEHAEGDDHDHGDHEHAEGEEHEHAEGEHAEDGDSASTESTEIRFVASKSMKVPGMECPYSCYPAVKEALAAVPGVEGVQLAEQPEGTPEGVITNKVVELKLTDEFNADAAIAALKAASFDGEVLN